MTNSGLKVLRILCPEPENYSATALTEMAKYGRVHASTLSQAQFAELAHDHDVLMVRLRLHLTEEILAGAGKPPLAVLSPTTGVNHLALPIASRLGVPVFHLRGERAFLDSIHSTAEHAFGLLLSLTRKIGPAARAVGEGAWSQQPFRGRELAGKRLGVVGCGRLGAIVARYALAFDMQVFTFDPYIERAPAGVQRCQSLLELCRLSDVVTLHVPWNDSTVGLMGPAELAAMPVGAFLINTARGEVLDEAALLSELSSGRLAGAALDVLANEHHAVANGSPLLEYARDHDSLIVTPHIAGATEEAIEKTDQFVIGKFSQWLATTQGA